MMCYSYNISENFQSQYASLSDEELAARRAEWKPRQPKITTGYLARYASLVTSGNTGAILKSGN